MLYVIVVEGLLCEEDDSLKNELVFEFVMLFYDGVWNVVMKGAFLQTNESVLKSEG